MVMFRHPVEKHHIAHGRDRPVPKADPAGMLLE